MAPTWVAAAVQESVGGGQKSVRFPPNSIPDSAAEAPSLFLHPKPPPRSLFFPPPPRPTIHSTLKKGGKGSFTVRTGRSETFGPFRPPRSRKERTKVSSFPVRTPPTLTAMRRNRSSTTLWESFGKLSLPAKRFSTAHVGRRKIFLASLRSFSTSTQHLTAAGTPPLLVRPRRRARGTRNRTPEEEEEEDREKIKIYGLSLPLPPYVRPSRSDSPSLAFGASIPSPDPPCSEHGPLSSPH